jgi:hypothetical protein
MMVSFALSCFTEVSQDKRGLEKEKKEQKKGVPILDLSAAGGL